MKGILVPRITSLNNEDFRVFVVFVNVLYSLAESLKYYCLLVYLTKPC